MNINKDSRIVEVFSADVLNQKTDKNELKDANIYIQELAAHASPENRYEIAQIMSFIIEDAITERLNYIDTIADVKNTGLDERAQFKIEIDGLKAMFQAKSATTVRSKVSNKFVTLDTEEVSIRPTVDFLELETGKVDLTRLSKQAASKMEIAIMRRVQDSIYEAFKAMGNGVNYNTGSGITKQAFDPILAAMRRAGGNATILGDFEALAGFTELTGFNSQVPEQYAVQHNENGLIGKYNGSSLLQVDNPFQPQSMINTELRKDLIYVVPSADKELRPVKVQFAGGTMSLDAPVNIDSKQVEFRFDKHVGVGVVGARKLLGVYEDSSLSE